MKQQNKVYLLGDISEILTEEKTRFKLAVRKNDSKFVYPTIKLAGDIDDKTIDRIAVGRKVLIEGVLASKTKPYYYMCPDCNTINTVEFLRTIVVTTKITFLSSSNTDEYYNSIFMLGTLCSDPKLKYISGSYSMLPKCSYIIESERIVNGSNFAHISTYSRQAEIDIKHLKKSSQIIINGSINTINQTKSFICECCSEEHYAVKDFTEIQGDRIEYLDNCIF